ncbi:MAG: hypothetical protein SH850_10080 [Planctomycetaceae bacterium]|nr:hypothetical protein [Planctomycetaceae bacterium]
MPSSNSLGWVQLRGSWRIGVGVYCDIYYDDTDWTPIAECTLDRRTSCVAHFQMLLKAVEEEARKTIPVLDRAIAELSSAIG